MILLAVLPSLFPFFRLAVAASSTGEFTHPPPSGPDGYFAGNEIWYVGDTQNLNWTTTLTDYAIQLFQQNLTTKAATGVMQIFGLQDGSPPVDSYPCVVTTAGLNLDDSNVFFFAVNFPNAFNSHFFNISAKRAAAPSTSSTTVSSSSTVLSTKSSSSSTASLTKLSSSLTASSTTLSSSATATATAKPGSDLPAGTKAAIGISVGIGIPLVLLLGALVFFKYRKGKNQDPADVPPPPPPPPSSIDYSSVKRSSIFQRPELSGEKRPAELRANDEFTQRWRYELPAPLH